MTSALSHIFQSRAKNPDVILSRMQEYLRKNYRVSGDTILFEVVRQIEEGNGTIIIYRYPKKLIVCYRKLHKSCYSLGRSLDPYDHSKLWTSLIEYWKLIEVRNSWKIMDSTEKHEWVYFQTVHADFVLFAVESPPVYAWNARFRVLNEIGADWDPMKELDSMERSGIEPDAETFHAVVDKISASGDVEGLKNMVYTMATKGFPVDAHINAASVFAFSIRGHYMKADSLCQVWIKLRDFQNELTF